MKRGGTVPLSLHPELPTSTTARSLPSLARLQRLLSRPVFAPPEPLRGQLGEWPPGGASGANIKVGGGAAAGNRLRRWRRGFLFRLFHHHVPSSLFSRAGAQALRLRQYQGRRRVLRWLACEARAGARPQGLRLRPHPGRPGQLRRLAREAALMPFPPRAHPCAAIVAAGGEIRATASTTISTAASSGTRSRLIT